MRILSAIILFNLLFFQLNAQITIKQESEKVGYRYSISTTYLSLANFGKPETNTQHYEIQLGYQLTQKDRVGIKVATWKLFAPMGIHLWNENFLERDAFYPGRLKETGVGLTYQRKLWKGLFASIELLPLQTKYISKEGNILAKGFKQYNSYHLGYHIPLFKKGRIYIEPQVHVNHWIINTNVPEEFRVEETKYPNYFLVEPNLYIGIKF